MFRIYTDVQVTRRKRFHLLVDERDVLVHSSTRIGDLFDSLREIGVVSAVVIDDNRGYLVSFSPLSEVKMKNGI